jgi:hypothetical protein
MHVEKWKDLETQMIAVKNDRPLAFEHKKGHFGRRTTVDHVSPQGISPVSKHVCTSSTSVAHGDPSGVFSSFSASFREDFPTAIVPRVLCHLGVTLSQWVRHL